MKEVRRKLEMIGREGGLGIDESKGMVLFLFKKGVSLDLLTHGRL